MPYHAARRIYAGCQAPPPPPAARKVLPLCTSKKLPLTMGRSTARHPLLHSPASHDQDSSYIGSTCRSTISLDAHHGECLGEQPEGDHDAAAYHRSYSTGHGHVRPACQRASWGLGLQLEIWLSLGMHARSGTRAS